MRRLIGIISFCLLSANATAEWSVAYGVDVIHTDDPDINETWEYGELRYSSILGNSIFGLEKNWGWHGYLGSNDTVGIGLFADFDDWKLGWGIESAEPNELTSTEGGYEILIEYAFTKNWAVSMKHRSNCKSVCDGRLPGLDLLPHGDEDTHNRGINYLMVRYTF